MVWVIMVKIFCNKSECVKIYVLYTIVFKFGSFYLLVCYIVSYTGVPRLPVVAPSV
jgi:hypothetical protein